MDRPDYPEMVGRLKPYLRDGVLKMNHVEFNSDTDAAFNAPVTGIVFLSLKMGYTSDEVEKALKMWQSTLDPTKGAYPPVTWGATHEDPNKLVVLIGWNGEQVSCYLLA